MMNFSAQSLELQMEIFEGPLSVLLNLIKKNKIDIFDIPIGWITDRFLEYVDLVTELNLRIAEDFIEIASLLIFIKARMLLPTEGEDPRDELVEKIIEYEKIRAMVKGFEDFPVLGKDTFVRGTTALAEEEEGNVFELSSLFFDLVKNRDGRTFTIEEIKPTLEEKLREIKQLLGEAGSYTWKMDLGQELRDRVATVLAILEITKLKLAIVSQRRPFGSIILRKR
jgi:segregation and condensation protein A